MKKWMIFSLVCLLVVSSESFSREITLYSHRHYPSDEDLFQRFTEKTGIQVKVVKAKADELIERLKAEGMNSPADVFMAADAGRLEKAKQAGLLKPAASTVLLERIPENLRDSDGQWFGFTRRARVIVYAKDRVDPSSLSTYEDLASEKWKGRILVRSSSNIYNQSLLASIIAEYGSEQAVDWARKVRGNMVRAPQGSDRDQIRAVAAGLGDIALVNTYYVGLLKNSPNPRDQKAADAVGIFFPNQGEEDRGTHLNISGAGITRATDNEEAAREFLEFLASDEAQSSFPNTTSEYPAVPSIEWSELLKSWGEFKADPLSVETLGELNREAVKAFNLAGWE